MLELRSLPVRHNRPGQGSTARVAIDQKRALSSFDQNFGERTRKRGPAVAMAGRHEHNQPRTLAADLSVDCGLDAPNCGNRCITSPKRQHISLDVSCRRMPLGPRHSDDSAYTEQL